MNKDKGLLQVGLVIAVASIFASVLIFKNTDFSSILAKVKHPWDQQKDGSCAIGRLCRSPEDNRNRNKNEFPDSSCQEVQEGCLVELKCTSGGKTQWFSKGRNPNCGHREEETPMPTPVHTPTPTPTITPIVTPTPTPTTTPTPTPTVTPTETPTPTGTPNFCNGTCGSNFNCQGGLFCFQGFCRNPACPSDSSCGCVVTSPTPTPAPQVLGASTPPQLPKTGNNDWLVFASLIGIMGAGFGIFRKFKLL